MTDFKNETTDSKLLYIYKVGNIAFSALCALLCAVSTLFFYDYTPGYFKNSAITIILYIAIAIGVIFAISASFTQKKNLKLSSPVSKASFPMISLIPACAFVYYAISLTPTAFEGSSKSSSYLLQIAFAIISFAYFFICAMEISLNKNILAVLGLASIVSPILIAVNSYFDYTTVMNGPEKLFMQFATVLFTLYVINEVRFTLGKPYPRFFISVASLSSLLCVLSATNKICIIAKTPESLTNENVALALLILALGVYSILRLVFVKEIENLDEVYASERAESDPSNTSADTKE